MKKPKKKKGNEILWQPNVKGRDRTQIIIGYNQAWDDREKWLEEKIFILEHNFNPMLTREILETEYVKPKEPHEKTISEEKNP